MELWDLHHLDGRDWSGWLKSSFHATTDQNRFRRLEICYCLPQHQVGCFLSWIQLVGVGGLDNPNWYKSQVLDNLRIEQLETLTLIFICSTSQWTNQNIKRVISFPSYSTSSYINIWFYKINMTFKLKKKKNTSLSAKNK